MKQLLLLLSMRVWRSLLLSFYIATSVVAFTNDAYACGTNKKFYVERYGVVGDGKTNDIKAFQALVKAVNANGGGVVVFPKGRVFSVSIEDDFNSGHKAIPKDEAIVFKFEHCKKVVLDLNESTFQMAPNHSTKYVFFMFFDCSWFSLSNGRIVGDAVGHDYSPVLYGGKEEKSSHEWGYGVQVRGSKGEIKDMDISRMTGDGIYYGSSKQNDVVFHAKIRIENCNVSYCRRNGISSDSSTGFTLVGSNISHIGDWEKSTDMPVKMTGCLPKSGIDFEYEGKSGDVGDILISGCNISDCTKFCIIASNVSRPEATDFTISDCKFVGSPVHTINLDSRGRNEIKDSQFYDAGTFFGSAKVYRCAFEMGPLVNYVNGTSFYNCVFVGNLAKVDEKHGCFMAGINMDATMFRNCKFKNIKGYNDLTPASQGFSGYVYPVNISFVSCDFDNCSFVVSQKNYDSRLSFDGCTLRNGCLIHNLGTDAIVFRNSELQDVDSYATQNGRFVLEKCKVVQEDASVARPFLSFGNHKMVGCTVTDKVGITDAARRKYGVKEYRIEAENTKFQIDNAKRVTKGLSLKGGSLSGIKTAEFQGKHEMTDFK